MDSFTHLLIGHAMGIAAAGLGTTEPEVVYWALLVGNSLPDVDVPLSLLLRGDIKLHRTFSHTLLGAAGLSVGAALLLARAMPGAELGWLIFWTLVGAWIHIGADALNLFGVRLSLFMKKPASAGILHITDPVLLVLCALGALNQRLAWVGLALAAVYIVGRAFRAAEIRRKLRSLGAVRADLIPWFAGWRYVAESADSIEYGQWTATGPVALQTYPRPDRKLVERLGHFSQVKTFLESARYPYAIVEAGEVVWGCALRQLRHDYRPVRLKLPFAES